MSVWSTLGSSPLARGLQVFSISPPISSRIIPARAGFTWGEGGGVGSGGDHPRSRGVYTSFDGDDRTLPGSSPLARGLPLSQPPRLSRQRIIPARVGFTAPTTQHPSSSRDHPRSRGVYCVAVLHSLKPSGSSPLARGLRPRNRGPGSFSGIIPARAGFTCPRAPHHRVPADHPRSRGVYATRSALSAASTGSSPLARGLLLERGRARRPPGIIPARAGFTLNST